MHVIYRYSNRRPKFRAILGWNLRIWKSRSKFRGEEKISERNFKELVSLDEILEFWGRNS